MELQPASAAAHGAPAPDGVVVRPAAAGAHRRAHDHLLRVRPVRRPAPDAGRHRSLRRQGAVQPLRLQRSERPADPQMRIAADENGAYWIDYVADVGDGFESTYAIAYLLAQDSLDVRGAGRLRHGEVLIMGGDQCYPQATREEYKKRLLQPFNWAFSVARTRTASCSRIPGNHDWYDGLNAFDSLFCSSRDKLSNAKGNIDRRLAVPAAPQLLGVCACPTTGGSGAPTSSSRSTSTPRRSTTSRPWPAQMGPQDNLIICLAEPSWMLADCTGRTRRRTSSRSRRLRAQTRRARARR